VGLLLQYAFCGVPVPATGASCQHAAAKNGPQREETPKTEKRRTLEDTDESRDDESHGHRPQATGHLSPPVSLPRRQNRFAVSACEASPPLAHGSLRRQEKETLEGAISLSQPHAPLCCTVCCKALSGSLRGGTHLHPPPGPVRGAAGMRAIKPHARNHMRATARARARQV